MKEGGWRMKDRMENVDWRKTGKGKGDKGM